MKKIYLTLFILVVSLFLVLSAGAESRFSEDLIAEENGVQSSSTLPESLRVIEESAFEGTSLVSVDLPDMVTDIEDNAFADNDQLIGVRLLADELEMVGNPFTGSNNVTIFGFAGGDSQYWAKEKGIRFILEIGLTAQKEVRQFISALSSHLLLADEAELNAERIIQQHKENRTGRTDGELKAAAYDGVAALYIRSRYFP